MKPPRILPPFYVFGAILGMLALHFYFPVAIIFPMLIQNVGLLLIAAGASLILISAREFKRRETNIVPFKPATELVTSGPFRFSRNPMYLGMFVILFGVWLGLGTLSPVIFIPAIITIIRQLFVLREEPMMRETFGERYLEYCRQVRRWI